MVMSRRTGEPVPSIRPTWVNSNGFGAAASAGHANRHNNSGRMGFMESPKRQARISGTCFGRSNDCRGSSTITSPFVLSVAELCEVETPEVRITWHFDFAPSTLRSARTATMDNVFVGWVDHGPGPGEAQRRSHRVTVIRERKETTMNANTDRI